MSKIIYVCYRKPNTKNIIDKIQRICNQISADNISPNPPYTFQKDHIAYGVSNPVSTIEIQEKNVLLGKVYSNEEDWQKIEGDCPDGNYAIFRSYNDQLEVLTDLIGTRTIWYYKDEEKFISSTSQRAIIQFLGNFEFDERVIPWMISSGSLGPNFSWDKRIFRVKPGSIVLDINSWTLTTKVNEIHLSPQPNISDAEYEERLRTSLSKSFGKLKIDHSNWALSLSGGHDCRGIMAFMNKSKSPGTKIKTVTWGVKDAEKEKDSDAEVARLVAKEFQTNHTYLETDSSVESPEQILERFLQNGEGRIDHYSGYTDGFQIWKTLFEQQIEGVIRGNQVFGQKEPNSALAVRNFIGIPLCSDFSNLQKVDYIKSLEQKIPAELEQREGETLSSWRDRLLQQYRMPVIQAALADLKFPYVEQFDPLLSRKIIEEVRSMPDHLRNGKSLYQKIVKSLNPGIKYASKNSTKDKKLIFAQKDYVELFRQELSSEDARKIFPTEFLEEVRSHLKAETPHRKLSFSSLRKALSAKLPLKLKKKIYQKVITPSVNWNVLAFRLSLIVLMNKLLIRDSHILGSGGKD